MKNNIININGNPFLQRSAEDELDFLEEIYYKPVYYDELIDNAINGASRMLVGQRGLGKSATIHFLFKELKQNQTLPLLITRYDEIPLNNNEPYFLYKIMQSLCNGIAHYLFVNKKSRKKLSKYQKEQLAFFIELFFDPQTSEEYVTSAKEIKQKQRWNFIRKFYNRSLPLINGLLNGAIEFGSDFIRKSLGISIDDVSIENVAREYLKEADLLRVNSIPIDEVVLWEKDKLIKLLKQLKEIANAIGYKSIVILFDKIDEYPEINANVDKIVDFVKDILLDTDFMYTKGLSIIFSIWSDAKRALNKAGVRFDKFEDINIEWDDTELEMLINKRLEYYTINKEYPVTMESLLPQISDRKLVLSLSNKSPRALIKLLGTFYSLEHNSNGIHFFTPDTLAKGMMQYCLSYDYYSNQSVKVGGKIDLYGWINKILQMKRTSFTADAVKAEFVLTPKNTNTYIQNMMRYELIKENIRPDDEGKTVYDVIDPRLQFLISRGVSELHG